MEIFETPTFTKQILRMLNDDEYVELQNEMIKDPLIGQLITGGFGLRKLRWSFPGKGKRGGLRIIYYFITKEESICMLLAYKKSEQNDLTREQFKALSDYVKERIYERQ